ncbi:hypothetical protein FKM82_019724 [Ascaphus truei]
MSRRYTVMYSRRKTIGRQPIEPAHHHLPYASTTLPPLSRKSSACLLHPSSSTLSPPSRKPTGHLVRFYPTTLPPLKSTGHFLLCS